MPVKIQDNLPAIKILENENVFVMTESRAIHQDIRPLKILILNIMPVKITTETHLLRALSNTPLQIEIDLISTDTYQSKNTPEEHLKTFYKSFSEVSTKKYDGLIITGAPVEHLNFEDVTYWPELQEIMNWSKTNVTSTLYICWAAMAGLYHFYKIPKYQLDKKKFGVFWHKVNNNRHPLVRGFDDYFLAPHSRHSEVRASDILKVPELELLSESDEAGVYIVSNKDGSQIFVTGHSEYDPLTLKTEYDRDASKGLKIEVPANYFPDNDPSKNPVVRWRGHGNLLYSNWIDYFVYQKTPFEL